MDYMDSESFLKFIIPILLTLPIALLLQIPSYAATIGTFFFAFGTGEVSSIFVAAALGINPFVGALLITYIESDMSLFISWNFDYLKKIPGIGRYIAKYEEKAGEVIKNHGIERLGFMAIFWTMFVPFHGTGAITMTLVGRLISLGEFKTWLAVTLGSLTRSVLVVSIIYFGLSIL